MSGYDTGYRGLNDTPTNGVAAPPCPHERERVETRVADAVFAIMMEEGLEDAMDAAEVEMVIHSLLDERVFGPLCDACAEEDREGGTSDES